MAKKRGGGSKTQAGKEESRKNALTHGLRSEKCLIVADETMEEYLELRNGWLESFAPEEFRREHAGGTSDPRGLARDGVPSGYEAVPRR